MGQNSRFQIKVMPTHSNRQASKQTNPNSTPPKNREKERERERERERETTSCSRLPGQCDYVRELTIRLDRVQSGLEWKDPDTRQRELCIIMYSILFRAVPSNQKQRHIPWIPKQEERVSEGERERKKLNWIHDNGAESKKRSFRQLVSIRR